MISPNRDGVERGIIEGEPADNRFVENARQWDTIYSELASFTGRSLARQVDGKGGADRLPDIALGDERRLSAQLRRLISRLGFWRLRLRELVGIEIDVPRRTPSYQGMTVPLTRREAQLLKFLSDNPGKSFSASQLVLHAWHATDSRKRSFGRMSCGCGDGLPALDCPVRWSPSPGTDIPST